MFKMFDSFVPMTEKEKEEIFQWKLEKSWENRYHDQMNRELARIQEGVAYNEYDVAPFPNLFEQVCNPTGNWAEAMAREQLAKLPHEQQKAIRHIDVVYHRNEDTVEYVFNRKSPDTNKARSYEFGELLDPVYVLSFTIIHYHGYTDCPPEWICVGRDKYNW